MKALSPDQERFFAEQARPLWQTDALQSMARFPQHGRTHCLAHCTGVAYHSYRLCCRLGLPCDRGSLIRGALLHDFFLYDWHASGEAERYHRWHGFTHPRRALANAEARFALTDTERDIVAKHMWPLTLRLPACREAWLVCLVDKVCTVAESLAPVFGRNKGLYSSVMAALSVPATEKIDAD